MIQEVELYLASLRGLHEGFETTLAGLTVSELDMVPAEGANSLTVIVSHAFGSERYLIGQLVGGIEIRRDRAAEFATQGRTERELVELIRAVGRESETVISSLSGEDLSAARQHRQGPRPVRWCILHAIEHLAEHLGHAGLTRQLARR